jgi:hypothetical protein
MIFRDIANIPARFLNDANDVAPGSLVADAVQPRWGGLPGNLISLTETEANKLSDTAIGTLHVGCYQYVQTKSGSTAAPARGIPCFWDTLANNNYGQYIVTPDATAGKDGLFAGVYISAPTKGNYCWIQLQGLCTIKYRASVTDTTAGDLVILVTATNTFDALADAGTINTAGGAAGIKNVRGVAFDAPANAGLLLAWMNFPFVLNFS